MLAIKCFSWKHLLLTPSFAASQPGLRQNRYSEIKTSHFFYLYFLSKTLVLFCKFRPNCFFFSILGAAGRCLALALSAPSLELTEEVPSVVEAFRKLCGPADPEVCRVLYPDSLRAKYGGNYLNKLSILFS